MGGGGGFERQEAIGEAQEAARQASGEIYELIEAQRKEDLAADTSRPWARLNALQVFSNMQRLDALDDLWTLQLEAAREKYDSTLVDYPATATAWVRTIQAGLIDLRPSVETLQQMLEDEESDNFNLALQVVVENAEPAERRALAVDAISGIDWLESAKRACELLLKDTDGEFEVLEKKLGLLHHHEVPEGDFGPRFKCALSVAALSAGVIATLGLGGAPLYVGLSIGGNITMFVVAWKSTGCPQVVKDITKVLHR